jgi:hypothetical protein
MYQGMNANNTKENKMKKLLTQEEAAEEYLRWRDAAEKHQEEEAERERLEYLNNLNHLPEQE